MYNHMRAQWVCSRERRIALYKQSSINQCLQTDEFGFTREQRYTKVIYYYYYLLLLRDSELESSALKMVVIRSSSSGMNEQTVLFVKNPTEEDL